MKYKDKILLLNLNRETVELLKTKCKNLKFEFVTFETEVELTNYVEKNRFRISAILVELNETRIPLELIQAIKLLLKTVPLVFTVDKELIEETSQKLSIPPPITSVFLVPKGENQELLDKLFQQIRKKKKLAEYKKLVSDANEEVEKLVHTKGIDEAVYFDKFLDNVPTGIVTTDLDGKVLAWNKCASELTGITHKEIIGLSLDSIFNDNEKESFRSFLENILKNKQEKHTKIFITRTNSNKEEQCLEWTGTKSYGMNLSVLLFSVKDVTQAWRTQQELKRSESQFRTMIEVMPQMAYIATADGHATFFNSRYYQYIGKGIEPIGSDWRELDIIHPDDFDQLLEKWAKALSLGSNFQAEYRLRRHDGVYRWLLVRAVPIKDDNGNVIQWLGTNTDINDQKENAKMLEDALKARDEFLSIASHELNTPLSSLKLYIQIFDRDLRERKKELNMEGVLSFLKKADHQVRRLVRLVADILDITRIRTGKLSIEKAPCDITETVRETIDHYAPEFNAKNIKFSYSIPEKIVGHWDRLRIEQVITNLFSNALRYGEGKPIEIKLEKEKNNVHFSVKDQGIGMKSGMTDRIFKAFERINDIKEISGLGLGLFITEQIVKAHNGKIWAESPGLGEGSTFHVILPIQ